MTPEQLYQQYRERFREGMDARFYTVEHLDELFVSGRAAILGNELAAIMIEIKPFPGGAVAVNGLVGAGSLDEIKNLIAVASQWGRENGCSHFIIESREGWARALKSEGFAPFQVSIVKEL